MIKVTGEINLQLLAQTMAPRVMKEILEMKQKGTPSPAPRGDRAGGVRGESKKVI